MNQWAVSQKLSSLSLDREEARFMVDREAINAETDFRQPPVRCVSIANIEIYPE
jgi:hypothetical protein